MANNQHVNIPASEYHACGFEIFVPLVPNAGIVAYPIARFDRKWVLDSLTYRPTANQAITLDTIEHAPSGTGIAAGTVVASPAQSLAALADNNIAMVLDQANVEIPAGSTLGAVFSAAPTTAGVASGWNLRGRFLIG